MTTLINLESFTKKRIHQLLRDFHTTRPLSLTEVILASLTLITEEHTKLLDHISEPSSRLIHRISHPPEGDISAKVVTACFICIWVHSFASCMPTFCKKGLSVISTAEKPSRNKTSFKYWPVFNYSPLQTMHKHITMQSLRITHSPPGHIEATPCCGGGGP